MIYQKRSTMLAVTLLSITLSTTGCIQKQERVVSSVIHQAPQHQIQQQSQQQLGAQTVPYVQPAEQYQQPIVQQTQQPIVQQIQQPIVQQMQQPIVQQMQQPIVQQMQQPIVQQMQQPIVQQMQQPIVQQMQQPTIQYNQPTIQYNQPTIQYNQPETEYVPPVQSSVQYIEPEIPMNEEQEEGCSDDISSNCDRGSIDKSQLSSNYTEESFGGTVHSFKSVQGAPIQIGERKNGFTFPSHPGKVIILEMFGKTCPHCIKEVPILKKLKSRYGNKLEVIAIHSQGVMGQNAAKQFIGRHRVNYPIIDSSKATDLQYFIQNTYGWTGVLPFTMVVKDGVTEGSIGGEASYKELKEIIDPLL